MPTPFSQAAPLSLDFFGVAVFGYCLALVAFVLYLVFRRPFLGNVGLWLVLLSWPVHLASVVFRGLESGHWPLSNMYEYSTGISLVLVTVALVLMLRHRMRLIGIPAMMLSVGLLGVGYMLYEPPGNLIPALQSYWLYIHVTAMATASALLSFSFFFGMAYLARRWADERLAPAASPVAGPEAVISTRPAQASRTISGASRGSLSLAAVWAQGRGVAAAIQRALPTAPFLDLWSYRFVLLGFPIWTFGVICGAIWGEHAWGRYWAWDPKETFAFITWVTFAIYLHARVTFGWKGKRAAAITAVGFVAVLFTLYAVNLWIVGLHSYARAS
ncbi:MAG TPA: c-type cytochrome biogenesis protein CcsB [Candidatus Binatia bacterium]|nr:c-type cytochrome biogenesis protein CcsB [Candidatus Binatia bacterium]